ncbi:MAG: ParB N-terminal domain-containing protein [Tessaracoccus sp.]|uniref:ParB N-terminal domain-containing protein n=1 Tax=Tessaracoccus sp. TaxID=1971211 RepID=UPI001EC7DA6A|nr:ParB N-terminal domain-containing protein [Tessaracoccus sp.]MBK7822859.1 ParB N-terminal domain-containing protein [Tessaracoccus sp.]
MTAVLFQSMPPLSPEEYAALEASIRQHGILVPITVDENGVVIDGHHRKAIAESLGIHCPRKHVCDLTETAKRTMALTLNLDRRNLTREQRRAIVEASVKADPQLSNREHARRTGADDKTVGSVRRGLERRAEIPHVSERTDSLGRIQPATKPPTIATPDVVFVAERIDPATGEVLDYQPLTDAVLVGQSLAITGPNSLSSPGAQVTGLDGKTYTRPEPKPTSDKQRRRPLTDAARDAAANPDDTFSLAYRHHIRPRNAVSWLGHTFTAHIEVWDAIMYPGSHFAVTRNLHGDGTNDLAATEWQADTDKWADALDAATASDTPPPPWLVQAWRAMLGDDNGAEPDTYFLREQAWRQMLGGDQ